MLIGELLKMPQLAWTDRLVARAKVSELDGLMINSIVQVNDLVALLGKKPVLIDNDQKNLERNKNLKIRKTLI